MDLSRAVYKWTAFRSVATRLIKPLSRGLGCLEVICHELQDIEDIDLPGRALILSLAGVRVRGRLIAANEIREALLALLISSII